MRFKMVALTMVIIVLMLMAASLAVCAAFANRPVPVTQASPDTARLYFAPGETEFTDRYAIPGRQPLDQWYSIRVFGETFGACAIGYDNAETIVSVNRDDMQKCGAKSS